MKANKAPEKLYIALNEFTEDGRTFVLGHRTDYPICTEYIRSDAFIKKACEWLSKNTPDYINAFIEHDFGEFVEDFRKAQKRE